ncbi:NADPH-dependent FMN reductase [Propioniciclava soli]|uniref:NADPH-dependent FMN reductase n=1 Tax=Propioniciclava soli TaxID=2775081 RepID=UPI001E510688|nr:NAD(P)H-dependent oxidoreductase [Propioniciclava soli]
MLTNSSLTIGLLVGSTRPGSFNQRLAELATQATTHRVVRLDGIDRLPFFAEQLEDPTPDAVAALRQDAAAVDALLVVTPEYNSGMPAVLKNALDWLSRPRGAAALTGLPAAVIGSSPSPGGARGGVEDAVRVLRRAGATVLDATVAVPRAHQSLATPDEALTQQLATLLTELADAASGQATTAA